MRTAVFKQLACAPWSARFGMTVVLGYILIAIFANVVAPYGQTEIVGQPFEPWSPMYPFGTDNVGRDILSRVIYGARNTIGLVTLITACSFTVGGLVGMTGATIGGWIDQILGRLIDAMLGLPQLILALLLLTTLGNSIPILVGVIALLDATRVYRISRALALNVSVLDFVEAARVRGEGLWWCIRREILPNIVSPLLAEFGIRFCYVILFISSLSFLGVGIQPPAADWGSMVRDTAALITFGDPRPLIPAVAISTLTISVNLIVDWLLRQASGLKE